MKGAERDLLKMSIKALESAYNEVNSLKCDYAAGTVGGGKSDTYGLDFVPEEVIKSAINDYDPNIVLVTEETGKVYKGERGMEPSRTVIISDPTDRSIKMRNFLDVVMAKHPEYSKKEVHEAFESYLQEFGKDFENPTISGASASITAIMDRRIIFNAMVNYITGELFVADPLCPKKGHVGSEEMTNIIFSSERRNTGKFVTFLGKSGYSENLEKCNLDLKKEDCTDPWTGGPLRILRLSSLDESGTSFILSNGEKIGEWIGWLSWVKYARDPVQSDEHSLEAYRLFFESPRTKELVSVAPGPHYSIFQEEDGETRVNLNRMFQLENPSHYRETILITPRHDVSAISRVKALGNHQHELHL